jgi:hypothetical protein
MELKDFDFLDLGGGVNEGQPWAGINTNEATILENFYPFGRKLRRRGGTRLITTVANWDENIFSMFPLKKSTNEWILLVGGATKLGKLSGDTIADLPSVLSIPSGTNPWCWFQYKDYAYCMREGSTEMLRVDESSWYTAGIAAPSVAPTIAQGAAGALTAADYYAVYTFYNDETGMESNPSPASSKLTLAASKMIDWSGVQTSSNPFVTSRRLYRTLPGQVGEYFYVGSIPNNVNTTYANEQVIIADMGRAVSFENGLPPTQLRVGTIWKERLFATDGTDLFYSEYLLPECFGEESILSIYPDDGHQIRAVHSYGDRLIIGKTNKIHYLVGADANSFNVLTLSDRHGCMSHFSMQSAEGMLFWYGSGNNFFRSDGNNVVEISTIKLRDTLDSIPDSLAHKVVAAVFPSLSWYVASVPIDDTGYNKRVLVYNYKTDAWTIFKHPTYAPQFLADFFDENLEQVLYCTNYDGNIYQYNDTSVGTDNGSAIHSKWVGKAENYEAAGYRKFFNEIWINCPRASGETVELQCYNDEETTPYYTRDASLDIGGSAWKPFKFATNGYPGTQIRLGIEYDGEQAIDIEGIHVKVGVLGRRPGQPM